VRDRRRRSGQGKRREKSTHGHVLVLDVPIPLGAHRLLLGGCVHSPPPALLATLSRTSSYKSDGAESGDRPPTTPWPPASPARASSPTLPRPPSPASAHEHYRATRAARSQSRPQRDVLLNALPASSPSASPRAVAGHPAAAQGPAPRARPSRAAHTTPRTARPARARPRRFFSRESPRRRLPQGVRRISRRRSRPRSSRPVWPRPRRRTPARPHIGGVTRPSCRLRAPPRPSRPVRVSFVVRLSGLAPARGARTTPGRMENARACDAPAAPVFDRSATRRHGMNLEALPARRRLSDGMVATSLDDDDGGGGVYSSVLDGYSQGGHTDSIFDIHMSLPCVFIVISACMRPAHACIGTLSSATTSSLCDGRLSLARRGPSCPSPASTLPLSSSPPPRPRPAPPRRRQVRTPDGHATRRAAAYATAIAFSCRPCSGSRPARPE
jgi:hypothetical protein